MISKEEPGLPVHEAKISNGKIKTRYVKISKINKGVITLSFIFIFIEIK